MDTASRRISTCYSTFATISAANRSAHLATPPLVQSPVASNSSVKNLNITFNMDTVWLDLVASNARPYLLRGKVERRNAAMVARRYDRISLEDFLALDLESLDQRYEYIDGHMQAMAGGTNQHAILISN